MSDKRNTNLVCVAAVGFFLKSDFICKEFSLLDCDSNFLYHTTIKSPKSFSDYSVTDRQTILSKTSHIGLEFDSGEIELGEFITNILPMLEEKRVITMHRFTANWLKKIVSEFIPIECVAVGKWFEDSPCMDDELKDICEYHDSDAICITSCALFDVLGLKKSIAMVLPHLRDLKNAVCINVTGFDLFDDGFICKEICILSLSSGYTFHTTVKSPKGWENIHRWHQSSIEFHTKFGNGLPYDFGEITFDEMIEKTLPIIKEKKIFVKDFTNMYLLQDMYKGHAVLEFIHCGKPDCNVFEAPVCLKHQQNETNKFQWKKYCAMRQAWLLKRSLLGLKSQVYN